ncbi:MAG: cytochrome c peroxidase [Bacteroidia bacterium]|nr:cytochrome c peroxidase [Bacteroidia bacterium]
MKSAGAIFAILVMFSCQTPVEEIPVDKPWDMGLPAGFPMPEIPTDNALNQSRIQLGKLLFYDPILSLDSTVSCATCHQAAAGFADHLPLSVGIQGRVGMRNSPTLTNVAYQPYFFSEGGSPSLELQALGPIENHVEMGFNAAELAKRIKDHPYYTPLAQNAYGREMDLFVLVRAIASFERTLISGNSPYDRYHFQNQQDALSESEKNGMQLFFSEKAGCSNCHSGINFTHYAFENNGIYASYPDQGRYRITLDTADLGKFKVPTLRNIALTAPYMHDGSLKTLEEVVSHYISGGKNHPNQNKFVKPLDLNEQEKRDLIHFLEALTDSAFVQNQAFVP